MDRTTVRVVPTTYKDAEGRGLKIKAAGLLPHFGSSCIKYLLQSKIHVRAPSSFVKCQFDAFFVFRLISTTVFATLLAL